MISNDLRSALSLFFNRESWYNESLFVDPDELNESGVYCNCVINTVDQDLLTLAMHLILVEDKSQISVKAMKLMIVLEQLKRTTTTTTTTTNITYRAFIIDIDVIKFLWKKKN